jgi:hypothetical protein
MRKTKSLSLLEELQSATRQVIAEAMLLKTEDPGHLLDQPAPGKWSVVQVLEHLNSYGRYYLVAIGRSLQQDKPAIEYYTPGWLGDYFTRLMQPKEDGTLKSKMQSPRNHRPPATLDLFPVLNEFIEQQQHLLTLLENAKEKNISAIRTPVSISRFIRLKVGDTFRFLIAHEQRHFIQIRKTLQQLKGGSHELRNTRQLIL